MRITTSAPPAAPDVTSSPRDCAAITSSPPSPAGRQPWSTRRHSRPSSMDHGRDPHTVRKAIDGADAVISTVSAERRKGPNHVAEVSR